MLVTLKHQTDSPAYYAERLAKKLQAYRHSDSVIAASTSQAMAIAADLANALEIPCQMHGCKAVKHPGNPHKTIGSITAGNVVLDNTTLSMPRDYIQHQVVLLQHAIQADGQPETHAYEGKSVIILREEINTPDEVLALVDDLKQHDVVAVILATPVINREALTQLEKQVSEVVYLEIQHHTGLWLNPYTY